MLNVHVFVQPFPNKQTSPKAKAYKEIIIVVLISVFENCKQSFQNFLTDVPYPKYYISATWCSLLYAYTICNYFQRIATVKTHNLFQSDLAIGKEKIMFWHSVILSFPNQGSPSEANSWVSFFST